MLRIKDKALFLMVLLIAAIILIFPSASCQASNRTIKISIGGIHAPVVVWVKQLHDFFIPEAKKRAAAYNIDLKFNELWAGAVAKPGETLEAIQNNILNMGYFVFPLEAAKLPLLNFQYWIPFGPGPAIAGRAAKRVYEKFPALTKSVEKYNQKLLGITTIQSYGLVSRIPINKVDDLKGRKIGSVPTLFYLTKAAGGVPVQADMTNMYTNIQTKLMDGDLILASAVVNQKLYEVAPYWVKIQIGSICPHGLTVNMDFWKTLPKEIQKIFINLGNEFSELSRKTAASSTISDLDRWKKNGGKVIDFPYEERVKWADKLPANYIAEKVKKLDEEGLPASEIVEAYIKYSEELGYKPPRKWKLK